MSTIECCIGMMHTALSLSEYVNGQRNIYMHSSGLLLSQQDGNWVFEQPNPHSQPAKVWYHY